MNPGDLEAIQKIIGDLAFRAMEAEARAARAEGERDQLRNLLTRLRTSLVETNTLGDVRGAG